MGYHPWEYYFCPYTHKAMSISTGNKIKKIREFKNYTQDYMAGKLGISQNAYSKIETGQSKLDTDRLQEISDLLDVPVETILNDHLQIFNSNTGHVDKYYGCYIENLQDENKELIQLLKEQIAHLQKENERLIGMLGQKSI